jgi:membrane-associated phospholipid phosphatase
MKAGSLNIVDRGTLAYNGAVLALVLLFHSRIPQWPLLMLLNILAIAVVLLLAFAVGERAVLGLRLLRNLAPLAFFLPLYVQTGSMNRIVSPEFLDPVFIRIEGSIFGAQPAVVLAQRFPQSWIAEYMHFAYASYYLLFIGLAVFLFLRRERLAFLDYMFSLCATMYLCLLTYIFLPVRGAVIFGPGDTPESAALPFTSFMAWIYRNFEIQGAAFPSSHVAIAALVLYYTVRYARSAAWIVGPLVVSLIVATVYCRYHYAIDALAGVATAAILIPLWRRINPAVREQEEARRMLAERTAGPLSLEQGAE